MKTQNEEVNTNENVEPRKKLSFEHCPTCGSRELIEFGVDTLCCHCEWDSCKQYVDEGLMDNRFLAFREQFDPKSKPLIKNRNKPGHTNNLKQFQRTTNSKNKSNSFCDPTESKLLINKKVGNY